MNSCVVLLIVTILLSPTRQQALVSNFLQSCLQHFLITLRLSRKPETKEFSSHKFSIKEEKPHSNLQNKKTSKEEEAEEKTTRDRVLKFQAIFFIKTHPH
jgi:hypothetical protein